MSHSGAGGATTSPSRDIMTQPPSAGAAAAESSASEEPPIFALPVELQKTVIEYLTSYRDMKSACLVCKQLNAIALLTCTETWRLVAQMRQYSNLEVLSCLHRKQSRVSNFQFRGIEDVVDWQKFAAKQKDLARVQRMQLCLENNRDCRQAAVVLERAHNLRSLDIDLNYQNAVNDEEGDGIPTMNLILDKVNAGNQCSQLTSLRLSRIDLPDDGYADCKLLQMPRLKHLALYDCCNYGTFLGLLAKASLDLDSISLVEEPGYFYEPEFATYGEQFLRSIKAPRRVALVLEGDDDDGSTFDTSWFYEYASTITSMKLQVHPCSELSWFSKASEFRQFCNRALDLQQLSMSGIEVRPSLWEQPEGLKPFLECISVVRTLKVIELWVHMSADEFPETYGQATNSRSHAGQDALVAQTIVQSQAKRTADMILSTLVVDCPGLAAVVIRTTWGESEAVPSVHAFLKSKQIDLYGRVSIMGMAVELCMVKHHEPCSEILESEKFIFD